MALTNASFREMLGKKEEARGERGDSREERERRRAKQQAAYERRMAIQKRREEALSHEAKYTDRAASRRKEEEKRLRAGEEAEPVEWADKSMLDEPVPSLPAGPTFAQLGAREEASEHMISIEQSKYLGGDIEHTHLVKGLDFALLQKMRSELGKEEEGKEKGASDRKSEEDGGRVQKPPQAKKNLAPPKRGAKVATPSPHLPTPPPFSSDLAREVHRAVFGAVARPNRALVEGRLFLLFDTRGGGVEVPSSVIRAPEEMGGVRRRKGLMDGGMVGLLSRLGRGAAASKGGEGRRKGKKEKLGPTAPLAMKPLLLPSGAGGEAALAREVGSGEGVGRGEGDARKGAGRAEGQPMKVGGRWELSERKEVGQLEVEAKKPGSKAAEVEVKKKGGGEKKKVENHEEDIDDIFGGVGSDYVCEPTERQRAAAARESRNAELLGGLSYMDDAPELEGQAGDEGSAASLLADALAGRGREGKGGKGEVEVVEEEEGDDEALLQAARGGKRTSSKPGTNLSMGAVADDSYGPHKSRLSALFSDFCNPLPTSSCSECFPESYEGFDVALGGSDDEANVDEEVEEGKGKGSKSAKVKAQAEEAKREAKMSRELVQIEKLMEERAQKRRRRDEGLPEEIGGGAEVSQNELF
ncbi:MAG: hypothetical protein SGPRY_004495 [Prymnesium sp.]